MKLTDSALIQFKKLIDESESPTSGIRFFTVQGCCSPTLQMSVAQNPSPGDSVIQMGDVNIFITTQADKILSEITLDYTEDGFRSVKAPADISAKKCC